MPSWALPAGLVAASSARLLVLGTAGRRNKPFLVVPAWAWSRVHGT